MKISYKVLFAAVLSIAGTNAFAADVTGLATTNYVKGAIESLDSSVADANGVIETITVTDGKISATRRQITNNDITDGAINQGKINGLSTALNAKQTTDNMIKEGKNITDGNRKATDKYPSMAVAQQIAETVVTNNIVAVNSELETINQNITNLSTKVENNKTAAEDAIKGLTGTGTGTTDGQGMVKTVTQTNGKVIATRGLVAKTDLDTTLTGEINGKMATTDYNTKTTMAADGTYAKKANTVGVNLTELDKGIVAAKSAADGAKSTADSALSKANANAANITTVTNTANKNKDDIVNVKKTADNSLQKAESQTFTNGHVLKVGDDGKVIDGGALGSLATKSTVTNADISGTIEQSKITGLTTALGNKQDSLVNGGDVNVAADKKLTINANAVVEGKIAPDAVITAKIKDLNVTTAKLAANAVTKEKIADDAVTTAKIKGYDNSGTTKECAEADGKCALVDLGAGATWLPIVNEYPASK